jgi:hypothetical protein
MIMPLFHGQQRAQFQVCANSFGILVDEFNVDVRAVAGPVVVGLNLTAQPMHWPASGLVPVRVE